MIVAAYIAEFLKKNKVRYVFGYDGSMMLKIADEISLLDGIDFLQGFHEQGSSFAADAYARINKEIGVLLVTSGPGAINALAGCADAYMDSVPLLIISGQDRYEHIKSNPGVRLSGFQDMDIVNIASPIVKYAAQVTDPSRIAYELEKCVSLTREGRKGPTWLDVPMDVQFMPIPEEMEHYEAENPEKRVGREKLERILSEIYHAKRPVILAGGGIQSSGAEEELKKFAEMTHIPVVTTLNGHDAYAGALGSSGLYGLPECNLAIYHADLLLAVGTRFGQQQVGKKANEYTRAKVIHIDIDEKELGRILLPEISETADVKLFLSDLYNALDADMLSDHTDWLDKIKHWKEMYAGDTLVNDVTFDPVKLVRFVGDICPDDAVFTNDVGQNTMWVCQGLFIRGRQRLLTSSGYASMGFSLPAAIGAKIAGVEKTVVSFSGDGGFHMNMQELQFVKLHQLNIKFFVFNNNTLGMMREVQRLYYNDNYVGSNTGEFICVDLQKAAKLYGLAYFAVKSEEDFAALKEVMNSPHAAIIDCRLPEDTWLRNWNDFKTEHPEVLDYDHV